MSQHLDDIEIPDIEIGPDWFVSDVSTREQCNDAFAYLMAAVAEIEYHLEMHAGGMYRANDTEWAANARRALKYKKTALQIINTIKSQLSEKRRRDLILHRNQVLLDHIRDVVSAEQFDGWIRGSGILEPVDLEQDAPTKGCAA